MGRTMTTTTNWRIVAWGQRQCPAAPFRGKGLPRKPARLALLCAGICWATFMAVGLHVLSRYASTPAQPADVSRRWPSQTSIPRSFDRATLLMFVHPKCPCTRASLGELDLLMTRCHDRVSTIMIVVEPVDAPPDWSQSDLVTSAARIPGLAVVQDAGGIEAARFHVSTSGQTILYDAGGNLLFHGGITSARGHAGDNDGRAAIVSLLT